MFTFIQYRLEGLSLFAGSWQYYKIAQVIYECFVSYIAAYGTYQHGIDLLQNNGVTTPSLQL